MYDMDTMVSYKHTICVVCKHNCLLLDTALGTKFIITHSSLEAIEIGHCCEYGNNVLLMQLW